MTTKCLLLTSNCLKNIRKWLLRSWLIFFCAEFEDRQLSLLVKKSETYGTTVCVMGGHYYLKYHIITVFQLPCVLQFNSCGESDRFELFYNHVSN